MKRPLYYLFCAIACTSMVSATMPMAAIAEAIQPRPTAEQQGQSDATNSGTGKAEDGTNTNATADTVEDSPAASTGTGAANTESADATNAGTTVYWRRPPQPPPIPSAPKPTPSPPRSPPRHKPPTPTPPPQPKTASPSPSAEPRPRGHRDDLPRNPDQRLVPGQGAHGRAHLSGRRRQPGKRLRPVAPDVGQLLQPGHRGPRLYLRLHGIGHVPHLLLLYGQRQTTPKTTRGSTTCAPWRR